MSDILRPTTPSEESPVTVIPTRASARYCRGEVVEFLITSSSTANTVERRWTISKDGLGQVACGVIPAGEQAIEATLVTAMLDEPGFLRCTVEWEGGKALGTAAIEPEAIAPSLPPPDDFEAFWAAQKAENARVPMNPTRTPVPPPQDDLGALEAFDIKAESAEGTISGYLVKPKGATDGSLPAIIIYHGAGLIGARMDVAALWASRGFLALDLNAHGVPNGLDDEYYKNLLATDYADFRVRGNDSRETTYFRGLFLRALRGLDFLAAQPEWDGKTLVAYGSSMGAAQSITASALDERVSFTVAAVPAMCDHSGLVAGRSAGWPQWVPWNVGEGRGPDTARLEAARYYDMMNMARGLRNSNFVVGWIDSTCTPTSVYAMYQQAGGEKTIFDDYTSIHTNTPAAIEQMRQSVMAHLESQQR